MSLIYRRRRRLDANTSANYSRTGVSVSRRWGPLSISTRGRVFLRLGPGLGFRIR